MGGYGALRIAMKKPGVFSSVYSMSACCLLPPPAVMGGAKAEAIKSHDEIAKADFGTKAMLASAAAWSPNPKNPPLFIDLPVKNGEPQPGVMARWVANAPLAMLDQYVGNLKALKGLALDVGDKDRLGGNIKELDRLLTERDVAHTFAIYDGDHVNHVSDRVEAHVIPFFTKLLVFGATGR